MVTHTPHGVLVYMCCDEDDLDENDFGAEGGEGDADNEVGYAEY
jgi:hypothetical protein